MLSDLFVLGSEEDGSYLALCVSLGVWVWSELQAHAHM